MKNHSQSKVSIKQKSLRTTAVQQHSKHNTEVTGVTFFDSCSCSCS